MITIKTMHHMFMLERTIYLAIQIENFNYENYENYVYVRENNLKKEKDLKFHFFRNIKLFIKYLILKIVIIPTIVNLKNRLNHS